MPVGRGAALRFFDLIVSTPFFLRGVRIPPRGRGAWPEEYVCGIFDGPIRACGHRGFGHRGFAANEASFAANDIITQPISWLTS